MQKTKKHLNNQDLNQLIKKYILHYATIQFSLQYKINL